MLIEIEERRLHARRACSSMFDFCRRRLGMSQSAAFRRTVAAQLVRRFPSILPAIERGAVCLSHLVRLRDHLDDGNVDELVAAVSGKTTREVMELLARRAPQPDVCSDVRLVPIATSFPFATPTSAPATAPAPARSAP